MCGLAGYIGNKSINRRKIKTILKIMNNRGPDNQNFLKFSFLKKNLYLFSSRLSIVDRFSRSNQPMSFEDLSISFNGEIYNIRELKKIIKSKKLPLKTKSDTEIILRMYQIYGYKCVNFFSGMWSFAIFDRKKNILFLSRDRIGEKPLFYFKKNKQFYFGSQTSFIRKLANDYNILNDKKIISFLEYGYKSLGINNESFFKDIKILRPGQNLIIDKKLDLKFTNYWSPKIKVNESLNESKSIKIIKENFRSNIKEICKHDLKIGLSLSGGIDSSYLLGFFKKKIGNNIKTYSIIDNDKRYNEENLIDVNLIKHKVPNTKIRLNKNQDYLSKLQKLIRYHDKPISTINYFIQSIIYEKMKKDKIKVSINGNGADELFAGYYHHYIIYYNSLSDLKSKNNFIKEWEKNILPLLRNPKLKKIGNYGFKSFINLYEKKDLKKKFNINYKDKFFTKDKLKNKMLNELKLHTVPTALIEDDLNAMYNSVENRSPFLNHKLVEKSFSIPSKYFMKYALNKFLLRKSSYKFVPDAIRLNREKKGFNVSVKSIFKINNKNFQKWLLNTKSPIFKYINVRSIKKLIQEHNSKLIDLNDQKLFNFISTKLFLENI